MSDRWFQEKRREAYYRLAKREGYRARSAYKLLQIQKKFRLVRPGDTVLDLGAAPGGWSQVAAELVGPQGRVVAVDLAAMKPVEGVTFVRGDFTRPETQAKIRGELARGPRPAADAVVSDMSPDISGGYTRDQAASVHLCTAALEFAETVLDHGGNLVVKIFEGQDYPEFVARVRRRFEFLKPFRPEATRKSSSEVYLVAKGFLGSET